MSVTYYDQENGITREKFLDPATAWFFARAISQIKGYATVRNEMYEHLAEFRFGKCLDNTYRHFMETNAKEAM